MYDHYPDNHRIVSYSRRMDCARKRARGFLQLTHAEQDHLATAFGQTIDPKLDTIGRMMWATSFERRLREAWAIPCPETREVTLGTLGM